MWQNDRRAPSFVYYGGPDGVFTTDRRQEFQTIGTQGVTVGDIDRDGWLDIVCPNYNDNDTRATQSRIYFGSADGLTPRRMVTLPTSSGTGSQIADYNGDGINDLLLICHRSEGDPDRVGATGNHRTSSFLYWGGRDGFSPTRRSEIPSKGAHYDSGVDLGNIYDRRFIRIPFKPLRVRRRIRRPHRLGGRRTPRLARALSSADGVRRARCSLERPGMVPRALKATSRGARVD